MAGSSGLALMFGGSGSYEGRVAVCYKAPPGLERMRMVKGVKRKMPVTKVCFPKASPTSKHLVKVSRATTINVAHLDKIGKVPASLAPHLRTGGGPGTQAEFFKIVGSGYRSGGIPTASAGSYRKGGKKKGKKGKK